MSGIELALLPFQVYDIVTKHKNRLKSKGVKRVDLYEWVKEESQNQILLDFVNIISDSLVSKLSDGKKESLPELARDFILYCEKKRLDVDQDIIVKGLQDKVLDNAVFNEESFRKWVLDGIKELSESQGDIVEKIDLITSVIKNKCATAYSLSTFFTLYAVLFIPQQNKQNIEELENTMEKLASGLDIQSELKHVIDFCQNNDLTDHSKLTEAQDLLSQPIRNKHGEIVREAFHCAVDMLDISMKLNKQELPNADTFSRIQNSMKLLGMPKGISDNCNALITYSESNDGFSTVIRFVRSLHHYLTYYYSSQKSVIELKEMLKESSHGQKKLWINMMN